MKKNLFSIVGETLTMVAVLTFVYVKNEVNKNNEIFNANVEALADLEPGDKTVMDYVCKYVGCCGGERKCFTGSVNVYGVSVEGTFYMD